MRNTWTKGIALAVALCIALSLLLPMAGNVEAAAAYEFPEYGPATYLGNHHRREMRVTQFASRVTYGGKDYLIAPARGGFLYIFRLSEYLAAGGGSGDWIYDTQELGFTTPRDIDVDSQGVAYVVGASNKVKIYDLGDKTLGEIALPAGVELFGVSVDAYNNIYLAGGKNDCGVVYRLARDASADSGYSYSLLYSADEAKSMSTVVCGDDSYVYAQGALDDGGSKIYKIRYSNGTLAGSVTYEYTGGIYYLSYVNGKIFGGHSTTISDGMIVVDASTMEEISVNIDTNKTGLYICGVVTGMDSDNCSYMVISSMGLCKYDHDTNTVTQVNAGVSSNLRVRDAYVNYQNSTFLLSFGSNSAVPQMHRISGEDTLPAMDSLVADASSESLVRSIAPGVPGTGVTVYVGAFLDKNIASYSPGAETPLNVSAFTNDGHAQTDAMITYNGKVYCGSYTGAYIMEYTPSTGEKRELIPNGLLGSHDQLRLHTLTAGDNKIFFTTVPDSGKLGGCIGWYDLITEELTVYKLADLPLADNVTNLLGNQIITSLVYDNGLLYGGSSKYGGGSNADTNDNGTYDCVEDPNSEALLMVFNVTTEKLLGNFSITDMELLPGSTGTFAAGKPWYIDGIAQDPDGKLWGLVDQTIFSFEYSNGQMTVTEELAGRKSYFTNTGGNPNWFSRPFLFDGNGNMYLYRFGDSLRRFSLDDLSDNESLGVDTNRIYTLGADGNIYYANGYELCRISTNPVSITEDLIIAANDSASIDTALQAYDALTSTQKAQIGISFQEKLFTLDGCECVTINGDTKTYSTVDAAMQAANSSCTVKLLVPYTGNITVENSATLDLDGKAVTGNITVTNGATLDLNGATVTGNVVANGTVIDSTDGSGSVTGTVTLTGENPCLPLLDGGIYRFFYYTTEVQGALYDNETSGQVNFWFDLSFTNSAAYNLLTGDAGLNVYAELYTDSVKEENNIVVFNDAIREWAAKDHSGTDDWALYVAVTNIPASVENITVKPMISTCGMTYTLGQISHDVVHLAAQAIFGAYPS